MIPTELTQLTDREKLQPWWITRLLPNLQRVTVARFTRRNDAEAYLMALRRLMPTASYCLVFAAQAPRNSGTVRP